ncbi:MAG: type II toxin-antitoxin system VapC family toxin [Acidimicrobiaceae bacterium]|nr:type II toxin-antitoxin system VapC family toxin [Acidimicrobiaceae bacterium]MYH00419.1 type II toxin-antitoxin system VapC family toxin [Acidimicrobiaceae bacterium]
MTGLLLDTHALLWWWADEALLPPRVRETLSDADTTAFVSAASAWEIATKVRLGRLTPYRDMVPRFAELAMAADLLHLPLTHHHGLRAGTYPNEHRDPFDRILAAQAELGSLTLVTRDEAFKDFPVQVLW